MAPIELDVRQALEAAERFNEAFRKVQDLVEKWLVENAPGWRILFIESELELFDLKNRMIRYPVYNKERGELGEVVIEAVGPPGGETTSIRIIMWPKDI